MIKTLTTKQAMRYSRQILLPGFDLDKQEILLSASVLIIGVGGLGCAAAQFLVASGVGKVTLVDDDKVENSNLQRQILHAEANIGMSKCKSALASLTRLNHSTQINTLEERQSDEQLVKLLKQHDLVLDCSDNLPTRNQLNQASYATLTPLVSGAAIRMEGQLFCVLPGSQSACYACISHLIGEQNLSCVESGVMSPIVGVIGSMQALEAIKVLTDFGQPLINKLMLFDGMTMQWQSFNVTKNKDCTVCQSHQNDDAKIG